MTQLIREDLETILRFPDEAGKDGMNLNFQVDSKKLLTPIKKVGEQISNMRDYRIAGVAPEEYLTKPCGLSVIETDGTSDFITWKMANKRAGTDSEIFEMKKGRIVYNVDRFYQAITQRNPSADIPEVINTLLAVKELDNPSNLDLFETAYYNGLYVHGEIEYLLKNIHDTKTMIIIGAGLGKHVQKYYNMHLDNDYVENMFWQIKRARLMDKLMDLYEKEPLQKFKDDLETIRDRDPRIEAQNEAKILLNELTMKKQ